MSPTIKILAPANELPAEGAEPKPFPENQTPAASHLLGAYASVFGDAALTFHVSSDGNVSLEATAPTEEFVIVDVRADEHGDPHFSLNEEETVSSLDLSAIAESVTGTFDADDAVRQLVERISSGLRGTVSDSEGVPVPLVRWFKSDNGGEEEDEGIAQLLGVWIADAKELEAFRDEDGELRILFEEADVEGRGLRGTVAALAVMGVMLGGATKADAGFLFFKSKAEKAAEQRAKMVQQVHPQQSPAAIDTGAVEKARAKGVQVIVDVSKQRAYVVAPDGDILIDTPVSTARSGKLTPRGEFKISQRVRSGKTSTIYGCSLPYWMRLGDSAIGLHVGDLPGYPASAGCIRLPSYVAPIIFDATRSGTTVKVVESWQPATQLYAAR